MPRFAASHLRLFCLPMSNEKDARLIWVNIKKCAQLECLIKNALFSQDLTIPHLRNRSALAVNCCVIIHCLEVSWKEDQITSAQRE